MKAFNKKFLFFFLFLSTVTIGQSGWYQLNSGTNEALRGVFFADANTGWVVGQNRTVRKTTDGGQTWFSQINNQGLVLLEGLFFTDSLNGIIVGGDLNNSLILRTTTGGNNWVFPNPNPGTFAQLTDIHFIDSNTGTAVGYFGTIIRTTSGGQTWEIQSTDSTFTLYNSVHFTDVNNGIIVGSVFTSGIIIRTTNGGQNWTDQTQGMYPRLRDVFFKDSITGTVVGDDGTILRTTNGGVNWFPQQSNISNHLFSVFFVDYFNGWICGSEGTILRTTNGGNTWVNQASGTNISLIDIFFSDSLTGTAVGGNGIILRTLDGGIPVELLSFTSEVEEMRIILNWTTATEANNSGFEIQRTSLFRSPYQGEGGEAGRGWEIIGFIPGFGTTTELKSYSFVDENVLTGIYKYRLKQIDYDGSFEYSNEVEVEVDFAPKEFVLYQNFPNPFNPSTTIKYSLPVESFVRINIYNALGEMIEELVSKTQSYGNYEVTWNAQNYSSGIYYYSFEVTSSDGSQSHREMKKIVFLK